MTQDLAAIATTLDTAQRDAKAVPQLDSSLSLDDAYAVQRRIRSAHEERGEKYIGPKLGFTSKAKMEQMGVDEIIVGFLTDAMALAPGTALAIDGMVHPRIEPELVFRLGRDVAVPAGATVEQVRDALRQAVDGVAVGFEIIDSRYEDFRFSLPDVVADNTSAAHFLVGPYRPVPDSLSGLAVELRIDGQTVESGTSDAILGDPFEAFEQLARMVVRYGYELPAGAPILAGAMTAAVHLAPGQHVEARVETFEPLTLTVAAEVAA